MDTELIPKQTIDSDSLSITLPISLMDVFDSGYVVSSNSNISELHKKGRRFHTAVIRLETANFIVNSPFRRFTHATGQSPARGSAVKSKEKKTCQQQSRHGLAKVPHLQKPAHIQCRHELFAELVQPFHHASLIDDALVNSSRHSNAFKSVASSTLITATIAVKALATSSSKTCCCAPLALMASLW